MSFDVELFTHRPGQSIQEHGKTKETRSVSEGFFAFSNTPSIRYAPNTSASRHPQKRNI